MSNKPSLDWWTHQIYRETRSFIDNPSHETEETLRKLYNEYRQFHLGHSHTTIEDEHERLMDFR